MKKSQQIGSLISISQRVHHEGSIRRPLLHQSWSNLAGTRNSSMGSPHRRIDPTTHRTMSERPYHGATSRTLEREIAQWVHPMKDRSDDPSHHERTPLPREIAQWVHPMKDRSDDPSHHERTLLPRSYISLLGTRNSSMGSPHEGSI